MKKRRISIHEPTGHSVQFIVLNTQIICSV